MIYPRKSKILRCWRQDLVLQVHWLVYGNFKRQHLEAHLRLLASFIFGIQESDLAGADTAENPITLVREYSLRDTRTPTSTG